MLRGLAAGAAVTTAVGAVVMRRWDVAAGRRVAELTRARASDEWRHEERVAELETDLEESRELRTKLEHKLRAKRSELANLRNEHAALLRRYATAETERASALEGRRLLAIEAAAPQRALPVANTRTPDARDTPHAAGKPAGGADARDPEGVAASGSRTEPDKGGEPETSASGAFSPAGSALFLRADSALARLAKNHVGRALADDAGQALADDADQALEEDLQTEADALEGEATETAAAAEGSGATEAAASSPKEDGSPRAKDTAAHLETARGDARRTPATRIPATPPKSSPPKGGPGNGGGNKSHSDGPDTPGSEAEEGEAEGKPAAVAGQEHGAAPAAQPSQPAVTKPPHATGHFTVPTAVAVVPTAPRRRPVVEGGFDFFGTQKSRESLESVQQEDLADVVGQEALAVHKAESESESESGAESGAGAESGKPVDAQAQAVGQIIDLTAHDETEQIDIQGLRTTAS